MHCGDMCLSNDLNTGLGQYDHYSSVTNGHLHRIGDLILDAARSYDVKRMKGIGA